MLHFSNIKHLKNQIEYNLCSLVRYTVSNLFVKTEGHLEIKATLKNKNSNTRNNQRYKLISMPFLVKTHLFFLFSCGITNLLVAQPTFSEQTSISISAAKASSVYAIDVDQDGDIDVLSSSFTDDKIAWYENNGSQNFTEHIISNSAKGASDVYAIDIDQDGDIDILSSSINDNKIIWYENNGSQNFAEHIISSSAEAALDVHAIDIDKDGDIDVLSASFSDDKIAWYENDGSQNFTEHIVSTSADAANTVFAIDLDSDGDIDVLSSSRDDNRIAWYENDGSQNFTLHTISFFVNGAIDIYAADIDQDGDIDVLSASFFDSKINWYENDGNQNFTEQLISLWTDKVYSVYATDLDQDGDIDVLSASRADNRIAWHENDGNQNFTEYTISSSANEATRVYAIDLDQDGDVDVLSASRNDDKIAWYKNDLITCSTHEEGTPKYCTCNDGDLSNNVLEIGSTIAVSNRPILRQFSTTLLSKEVIPSNQNVTYRAGESIHLTTGFHAQMGSEFLAEIVPCTNSFTLLPTKAHEETRQVLIKDDTNIQVHSMTLQIHPNLVQHEAFLKLYLPQTQSISITLYNQNGQLIEMLLTSVSQGKGTHNYVLQAEALPSGTYFVQAKGSKEVVVAKLMVQH